MSIRTLNYTEEDRVILAVALSERISLARRHIDGYEARGAGKTAIADHWRGEQARAEDLFRKVRPEANSECPPAGEWISITDKRPDADMTVLIALDDGEVWTGFLDGEVWRYVSSEPINSALVTHWMSFPEPPAAG